MARAYSEVHANYGSRAQGVHGSGSRNYAPDIAQRVLMILLNECIGPEHRMTVEVLTARVGINGRALRNLISDLEKAGRVLTDFSDGYYVCSTVEQAERATRRMESQISKMQVRVEARRKMAAKLVANQLRLV